MPTNQIESVIKFLRWLMPWWLVCEWSVVMLGRHGWMQMSMKWSRASALKGSLQNLVCPFEKRFSCLAIWRISNLALHTSLLLADSAFVLLQQYYRILHDLVSNFDRDCDLSFVSLRVKVILPLLPPPFHEVWHLCRFFLLHASRCFGWWEGWTPDHFSFLIGPIWFYDSVYVCDSLVLASHKKYDIPTPPGFIPDRMEVM